MEMMTTRKATIMTTTKAMIMTHFLVLFSISLCTSQEHSSGILDDSLLSGNTDISGNTEILGINSKFLDSKYLRGTISNFKRNDMSSTIIDQSSLPDEYLSTVASAVKSSFTFDTSLASTYTVSDTATSMYIEDTSDSMNLLMEGSSFLHPTPQLPEISVSNLHSSLLSVIEIPSSSSVYKMHTTSLQTHNESSNKGANMANYSNSYYPNITSEQELPISKSGAVSFDVSVQKMISPTSSLRIETTSTKEDVMSSAYKIKQISSISEYSESQTDITVTLSKLLFEFSRMESSMAVEKDINTLTEYSSQVSVKDYSDITSIFESQLPDTVSSLDPSLNYIPVTTYSQLLSDSVELSSVENEITSNTVMSTKSFSDNSMSKELYDISILSSADSVYDSKYDSDMLMYSDATEMILPTSVKDTRIGLASVTPSLDYSLMVERRESSEIPQTSIGYSEIPSISSFLMDYLDTGTVSASSVELEMSRDTSNPLQVTPQMTLQSSTVHLRADESFRSTFGTIGEEGYSSATGSDLEYSAVITTFKDDAGYRTSVNTVIEKHNATMATIITRFDNGSTTKMVSFTPTYDASTLKSTTTQRNAIPHLLNVTYEIVFRGECASLVKKEKLVLGEFWVGLRDTLKRNLSISEGQLKPHDIVCNPIRIVFSIFNIYSVENTTAKLYKIINSGSLVIKVLIPEEDRTTYYVAVKLNTDPTFDENDLDDIYDVGLTQIDIIVIISVCVFSMILVCLGFIVCAREYYVKKRTRSFDLSEIVNINSQFDDYSLTKCPRPKVTYSENGMKMHSLGKKTGKNEKDAIGNDRCETETLVNDIQLRLNSNESGLMVSVTGIGHSDLLEARVDGQSRDETEQSEALLVKHGDSPLHSIDNPIYFADDDRFAPV